MNYYQVYDKSLKTVDLLISKIKKIQQDLPIDIELVKSVYNVYYLKITHGVLNLSLSDRFERYNLYTYDDAKIDINQLWQNIYDSIKDQIAISVLLAFGPLHPYVYKSIENAFKIFKNIIIILNTVNTLTENSSNDPYILFGNHMEFFLYNTFPELKFERNITISNNLYKSISTLPVRLLNREYKIAFNFINLLHVNNLDNIVNYVYNTYTSYDNDFILQLYTKYILEKNGYNIVNIYLFNDYQARSSLKTQYSSHESQIEYYCKEFMIKQRKSIRHGNFTLKQFHRNSMKLATIVYDHFKSYLNKLYKNNNHLFNLNKQNKLTIKEQQLYDINKKEIEQLNGLLLKYIGQKESIKN